MRYEIKRQPREIDDVISKCDDLEAEGANPFHGLTYHEGVKAGILWLIGQYDDNPIDE